MKDCGLGPPLCAARDFTVMQRQVATPFITQIRDFQGPADTLHDPMQAITNITPCRVPSERQDDRVVQAAASKQYRATSGTTPEDGYRSCFAGRQIYVSLALSGLAENNALLGGFPEPQDAFALGEKLFIQPQMIDRIGRLRVDQ